MKSISFKEFGEVKKKMNLGVCKKLIQLTEQAQSFKDLKNIVEYIYYGFLTAKLCEKLHKFTDSAHHITILSRDNEQEIGLGKWENWEDLYSFTYNNLDIDENKFSKFDEDKFKEDQSEVKTQLTLIQQFLTGMKNGDSLDDWVEYFS